MAAAKDRWTVKKLMIVIALLAVILYCGKLYVEGYIWMIQCGVVAILAFI